jgi:hypothetical protein
LTYWHELQGGIMTQINLTASRILKVFKESGKSQQNTGQVLDVCQPVVSRIKSSIRDLTVTQVDRLADHLKLRNWQLMLRAVRDTDDPRELNDLVARLADELSFALKQFQARAANNDQGEAQNQENRAA